MRCIRLLNLRQVLLTCVHVHLSSVPCSAPFRITFLPDPTDPLWVTF
jgi:hypothetical protein